MVKVFIPEFLKDAQHIPLLIPNLGEVDFGGELFKENIFRDLKDPMVEIVPSILDADFILLPHNFSAVTEKKKYLETFIDLHQKYKKKIIIFAYGDRDMKVDLPGAIVFKYSMYKSSKLPNEIKMPTYVEDLGKNSMELRQKHTGVPIVGFCGWADYGSISFQMKAMIRNSIIDMQSIFYGRWWRMRKKGVYFRKRILNSLVKSKLIIPNFIIRNAFSSNRKTIGLNPELARNQYVENILNSDFSLAIRGDGNDSMRFYEILSLGRIPVLIDTDIVLPMEDEINYKEFILRIPLLDFNRIDEIIADFYKNISPDDFLAMQTKMRSAFEKYLKIDSYFRYMFSDPKVILSQINK